MSTSLTPTGNIASPIFEQPTSSNEIVGLNLQNTSDTVLAAQPTTFGETFAAGAVQTTDQLTATINGKTYAVQMDVKTFNPDGSVAMAVLTLDAPALPPNSTTGVMLSIGGTADAGISNPAANLVSALQNYTLSTTLNITANAGGNTGVQTINIAQAVETALANHTATMWLNGPLAQQAIVSIPVTGSLRIEADVTAYANGTISANLQFNNDAAMQAAGGTITYSTTITQNGSVVSTQPSLTQYQYQDWSTTIGTAPAAGALNIQHDVAYLEKTGAVPNYDTQYGIASGSISGNYGSEASQIAAPGWNAPLGVDGITQNMPTTGGRGDIGPTTASNATWLITQNATAATYALGQAQEAGSVPWHFYDPTSNGSFVNTADIPSIWTDPRGNPTLTQPVSGATGWKTDPAHMPDLSYVAYMQTGNAQYLEQLNAQASFAETDAYPPSNTRDNGQGLVVNGQQIRASAWSLRTLQEAAYANPAGSADKTYFTQMVNNNYSWLLSMIPTWTTAEGEAHGYLPGSYGSSGVLPPWQQDYFASSIIQGAEMGNQSAVTYLQWASNFLVGRFFADSSGFSPKDAIAYNIQVVTGTGHGLNSGAPFYTTWSGIEQATEAVGQSNVTGGGNGWTHSGGDYGVLALQTLAGIITVSTSSAANAATMGTYQYQAMQAFGWLLASGAPYILPSSTASTTPQFLIDPRLANGQLLSFGNVTISTDTTPTLLTPVDPTKNALLYAGAGADTLIGGSGINLLFGGSGADTIIGGPNGNDIFAGSGDETIIAGGGTTFIQTSSTNLLAPGTGKDLMVFNTTEAGSTTINGFNPAYDKLDLVDGSGKALLTQDVQYIYDHAMVDGNGNVVLMISSSEKIVLEGVSSIPSFSSLFSQQDQAITVNASSSAPPTVSGGSGGSGSVSGSSGGSVSGSGGGYSPPAQQQPINIIEQGTGAQTILGTTNVETANDTVSGNKISALTIGSTESVTIASSNNTISAYGGFGKPPSNGDFTVSGSSNTLSISGGSFVVDGTANTISASYAFGRFAVDMEGSSNSLSATGNMNGAITVGGSGNTATLQIESTANVTGTKDTVTAETYSQASVSGSDDLVNMEGNSTATVSGSSDTITSTGFDKIDLVGGTNAVSIGAGAYTSTVTASAGSDTVIIGVGDNNPTDIVNNGADLSVYRLGSGKVTILPGSGGTITYYDSLPAPTPTNPPVDSSYVSVSGSGQTITGSTNQATINDADSNVSINADNANPQEHVDLTGSSVTLSAVGAAGADASAANYTMSGSYNTTSITGGTMVDSGSYNKIDIPYVYGWTSISETGSHDTVTAGSNSSPNIDVSGNQDSVNLLTQSSTATISGNQDTVSATTYSRVDMVGTNGIASINGNAAMTLGGSGNTVVASGFNNVDLIGKENVISVPGGSWISTLTATAGSDTIYAGATAPGGSPTLQMIGGSASLDVVNQGSENLTLTAGTGQVTVYGGTGSTTLAGGSTGNNLLVGGSGYSNVLMAGGGNTTLQASGAGSTKLFAGGGAEVLEASTITGASSSFVFGSAANGSIDLIGLNSTNDAINLIDSVSVSGSATVASVSGGFGPSTVLQLSNGGTITMTDFTGSLKSASGSSGSVILTAA